MNFSKLIRPFVVVAAVAGGLFLTAPTASAHPPGYGGYGGYGRGYGGPVYGRPVYGGPVYGGPVYRPVYAPVYRPVVVSPGFGFSYSSGSFGRGVSFGYNSGFGGFNSFGGNSFRSPGVWGW